MSCQWQTELDLHILLSLLALNGVLAKLKEHGIVCPGAEHPEEGQVVPGVGPGVGINKPFALHAGLGLLWMVMPHFTTCHTHTNSIARLTNTLAVIWLWPLKGKSLLWQMFFTPVVQHMAIAKLISFCTLVLTAVKTLSAVAIAQYESPL